MELLNTLWLIAEQRKAKSFKYTRGFNRGEYVQDDHLAGVVDGEQLWTSGGWAERFGLPYDLGSVGYGQSSDEVGAFGIDDLELLMGYHAAVHRRTVEILEGLTDEDYARIVDERWDPPVTCAVRLVSVVNDITQHLGQAAYVAGLARRR